jgi:hypothetical protein
MTLSKARGWGTKSSIKPLSWRYFFLVSPLRGSPTCIVPDTPGCTGGYNCSNPSGLAIQPKHKLNVKKFFNAVMPQFE